MTPLLKKWILGIIGVLVAVIALWRIARPLLPGSMRPPRGHFFDRTVPMTPEKVESWMTFDYINVVFKLPQDYLIGKLGINGSGYPRITLRQYAKQSGRDPKLLMQATQNAIREYQSQ